MHLGLLLVGLFACSDKAQDTAVEDTPLDAAPWPDWAFHHWVWEDESTTESLMEMVDGYAANDIPVGAVIIDSPWATGYSTYEWDTSFFPDPQGLIDDLHDRDIRVMLWTVPMINTDVKDLYAEAADAGYFLTTEAGGEPLVFSWWKGDGSLIDYFNPEAVEWWHELMAPVLEMGIDGWKCDGAEYSLLLTPGWSEHAGRTIDRLEYSRAYYDDFFSHTRDVLGDDRINTARPIDNYGADLGGDSVSFASVENNWAGWVGDQDPDFEGLKMALRNMYWSADYGYVSFGSDIGGYRTDDSELGREKEPFIRWAQMGAFSPVMENGGAGAHWPWQFDEETVSIYRDFVNIHYSILEYLNEQGAQAIAEERSMLTFLSDDTYQYLLGEDVFVAPILEEDGLVNVTFPSEDDWVYVFDDSQVYAASETVSLTIPLTEFSVFVRKDSEISETLLSR